MRVSTGMIQQSTLNQLQTVWSRVQELQTRISTGKRIQRPSDDPIATGHILRTRSNIRATNQYLRNIDESAAYANAAESVVTRLVDLVQTVQTIAVKIADDSYGPVSLAGLGTELEGLLDEAMGHANTKYAGTRLFGGFQTRSEPFETTLREDGQITGVQAVGEGLDGDINRLVGENLLLTINLKGSDLFGEDLEFFDHIIALRDAAMAGDHDTAREIIPSMDGALDRLNLSQALIGGLQSRIDDLRGWQRLQQVELESMRSEHEDLDMAEAAMELQKEQSIMQAALSATSYMTDFSLVNYLM